MHIFITPTATAIRTMLYFPEMHIRVFYQLPKLSVKTEHTMACCCHLKHFQLQIRTKTFV